MVPFTPATGTRILCAPRVPRDDVIAAVVRGAFEARTATGASSLHLLFLREDELAAVTAHGAFVPRLSTQFHWHNDGYRSFDDFLGRFRSALRKQVHRERRRVRESGLDVRVVEGRDLGDREWDVLAWFYFDTCRRRGSGPYLTEAFFGELRRTCAASVVAALAYRGAEPVAGTLNFERGRHLYGRYWGAREEQPGLHFELCYYRLIERAIERGLTRFEAGAQGIHKLRRGLMPHAVHSAHWIAHPVLARAVAEFLPREAEAVRGEMASLAMHGPFRRG
jgi:predicted N-acyltransferase